VYSSYTTVYFWSWVLHNLIAINKRKNVHTVFKLGIWEPHSFTKMKMDIFTDSYQVKKSFFFHFFCLPGWGGSWLLNIKWEPVMHADAQDIEQQRNTKFRRLMKFSSSECRAKPYRLHSRRDGGITAQCASRCQADSRYKNGQPSPPPPPPSKSIERDTEQVVFVLCSVHSHTWTVTGFCYCQHGFLKR
jgi:hypothetical protein